MPFRLGAPELILILVIILIVFGAGKLPQIGGAIGKAMREFRKARAGEDIEEKLQEQREKNVQDAVRQGTREV